MAERVVLSDAVHGEIVRQCLAQDGRETGGTLIGCRLGPDIVVSFCGPAGQEAVQERHAFTPDHVDQQRFLDYVTTRFPETEWVGDWHLHPGSFDKPSSRDHQTAREIVSDLDVGMVEAVFPIAIVRSGRVEMKAYRMYRFAEDFDELPIEVVPDTDRRVLAMLLGRQKVRS